MRTRSMRWNFKPGPCSKYDPSRMVEQVKCKQPFEELKWGANGKCMYATCEPCGLKTCIMYNRKEAYVSDAEEDPNEVHVVQLKPGLVMIDTGCRTAVG